MIMVVVHCVTRRKFNTLTNWMHEDNVEKRLEQPLADRAAWFSAAGSRKTWRQYCMCDIVCTRESRCGGSRGTGNGKTDGLEESRSNQPACYASG